MKLQRIFALFAFAILLNLKGLSQSTPPWTLQEIDGSPKVTSPTVVKVTNGTLSCSGKVCTITISGGGGGSPGGASGTVQWNDSGAFNGTSGLTATASTVTIVSGVSGTFSRAGNLLSLTNTTDSSSVQVALLQGDRATVAGNDEAYQSFLLSNASGTQKEVGRLTWAIPTATAASENGRLDFSVMTGGTLAKELQLAGADLSPSTSDGLALGTTSLPWSDLFMASGAVIDFAAGNVVLTHSSGILTMGTGELRITTTGTNAASVPTLGSISTFTNKTLTASSNVLGGVTMTMGSDATGDIYYRNSGGVLTRLGVGSNGQVLTLAGGLPSWAAGGGGITVGTTTITGGTSTDSLFNNGGVVGSRTVTGTGNDVLSASPTLTGTVAAAAATFSSTIAQSSTSATAFASGASSATPSFLIDNSTSSQASGMKVIGKADGTASELKAISRTQTASSIAGNGIAITADPAIAGSSNAGAAAGGNVTITAGDAARLTSGNGNGGNITLITGSGIGTGVAGLVGFGGTTSSFPAFWPSSTGFFGTYGLYTTNATGVGGGYLGAANFIAAQSFSNALGNTGMRLGAGSLEGVSTFVINWSNSSTNALGTQDIGFARAAAGVVKPTNASTGAGTFSVVAVTPAQITSDQNNYAPGVGWFQRWSSDASRNVTGLAAGVDGQVIEIWNVGAQNIVLQNQNASSTAANRFLSSTGADLTLAADKCAEGRYDATTARWRVRLCN